MSVLITDRDNRDPKNEQRRVYKSVRMNKREHDRRRKMAHVTIENAMFDMRMIDFALVLIAILLVLELGAK